MRLKAADKKFLGRESEAEDIEVARTRDAFVFDSRGKKYIDFLSGWCVGNFGWGGEHIRKAIAGSKSPAYVYPEYLYAPWVELAQMLAEITPGKLQKCYRATGGSEAVDIALQIAMVHTGRRTFISVEGSYHGNSIAGISVGSSETRRSYSNLLRTCQTVAPPLGKRAAQRIETLLKRRDVAAVIMEPISCNLAVLVPEDGFMERVAGLCRRYGTLLIMDEVASGFGRTGRLFASEYFDIEPDILCMAKALSGGFAPIGAAITTQKVAKSIDGEVGFYSTFGWHPLAVDAAIANVRWIMRNRERLLSGVNALSAYFEERLRAMEFEGPAEVRVRGMAIAVETGDDESYVEDLTEKCLEKGLLVTSASNALTMFPPLTLDRKTAKRGLDILESCIS
jgi:adenosylmethionine-8-amino-7-oxononanoate aminotransferase